MSRFLPERLSLHGAIQEGSRAPVCFHPLPGGRRILDEKLRANIPNIAEIKRDATLNRFVDPLFLDQTEFHKLFKDNAPFCGFVRELVKRRINKTSP